MPKLAVDLVHPADVNFYKHAVRSLEAQGWEVVFVERARDNLARIFASEFPDRKLVRVGQHQARTGPKLRAAITRPVALARALRNQDIDVVTGFGSHFAAFAARMVGARGVVFYDDHEYRANVRLCRMGAHEMVMMPEQDGVGYPTIKELAYLHPDYFAPDKGAAESLGVEPGGYVFLRDKEYVAMNYRRPTGHEVGVYDALEACGMPVVALTHDPEHRADFQRRGFRVLEKPLDIHSLLAFARGAVTFGDTMAREAALLGTPTLYLGDRDMAANRALEAEGALRRGANAKDVRQFVAALPPRGTPRVDTRRWVDTTRLIVNHIQEAAV